MDNILKLHIENFRAIHDADIILNGITVISGENGCGKSTISKVLYRILKTAIEYDEIKNNELQYKLFFTKRNLCNIGEDIYRYAARIDKSTEKLPNEIMSIRYEGESDTIQKIKTVSNLINSYGNIITKADQPYSIPIIERLNTSLRNMLITKDKNDSKYNFEILLQRINDEILKYADKIKTQIKERSIDTLDDILSKYFEEKQTKPFELSEYGALITDREIKRLNNINSIDKTIYIDTPMSIGFNEFIENNNFAHWNDIDKLLKKQGKKYDINNFDYFKDSINGDITIDNISHIFKYRRKSDGFEINLLDAATGIKAFAAIQLLLKNGHLTDKTLMIIDEPEAHLHPQWIVEYARLIVLLNKNIGIKFLIDSHNPDMVSAIKYISEKENGIDGTKNVLNFYVANKENNEQYSYKSLGTEIEEIFESFNLSIDRINLYGGGNDE